MKSQTEGKKECSIVKVLCPYLAITLLKDFVPENSSNVFIPFSSDNSFILFFIFSGGWGG